jgi:hypothetical protein
MPDSNDLTTLGAVRIKAELQDANTKDDQEIGDAITAFSQYFLYRTGIASFSNVVAYVEVRDGNGNDEMFTRNRPITTVASVLINGVSIPAAGSWPSFGYYVSDDKKSIKIRAIGNPSSFSWYPRVRPMNARGFDRPPVGGGGNVVLSYSAGFGSVPADLEYAVRCIVALNYKRKSWQGLKTRAIASGGTTGTTSYTDVPWPKEYDYLIEHYRRLAAV